MDDKTWTAADAKLLREMRVAAGVDRATFARRCTLSVGQLAELEDGGSGRFYSEGIKSHTGRTLLARLGHVRPATQAERTAAPSMTAATAPAAAAPSTQAGTAAPAAPATGARPEAQRPAAAAEAAPSPASAASPVMQAGPRSQEPVSDVEARPVGEEAAAPRSKTWIGLLVVACVLIAGLAWMNRPQPPAQAPVPVVAEPAVEVPALPASAAEATAAVPAAAAAPGATAAAAEPRCPAASGSPVKFVPGKALKPGNYVYIQASRPTLVCVTDASQQVSLVQVQPGEGETVNGTPPFTLQSSDWAPLKVFYQGVRVPLEEIGAGAGGLQLQSP